MKIGDRCFVHGYIDEIRKDTVIVRNDGGYFGTIPSEVMGELSSAQQDVPDTNVGDMISRQAAIDALGEKPLAWTEGEYELGLQNQWEHDVDAIRALPPVTPKPKVGHWIEGQTDNSNIHNILCSCCFEGYPSKGHANSQYTKDKFQWCPKCGAKMIEPQESEE